MNFPSINIQGTIISGEILAQIRAEQQKYQNGKDFGFENNLQLKDEIVLAWSDLKDQWKIFNSKLTRIKEGDSGASETRTFWMDPFFANLGYKLEKSNAEIIEGGKSFNINRRDVERDGFPVYIAGWFEKLDRKPATLRMSPHALVQEYLNVSEHLYALVTNGRQLRLLRDATLLSRTSCVEFDLEKIFEEDLFADFSLLFRLLHATRMPTTKETASECILEHYHVESLASGSRIRENLSKAVKEAIKLLGNGFLQHPLNSDFREAVKRQEINGQLYYQHQLRIIYRLLFLFVIEEKNLVFATRQDDRTKKHMDIYRHYYSVQRLRKLAGRTHLPDMRKHYDLWMGLLSTFSLYENTATGIKMGIMALNGDLFGNNSLSCSQYNLKALYLDNSTVLKVLRHLCYFENDQKVLIAVNYRDLDVEEFGSVYEGLLELEPTFETNTDVPQFYFTESSERSKSGSHYTPEELVQPLIKHSLNYIIEDKLKEKDKETALLSIKVCDVACGSGHILLSAGRRIALELARVRTGEDNPNLEALRKAMRDVIRNCIYGVDKNPLAVELCKVALWLEAHNPGEPLNFLDHRIKCGDAIVGLAHREELQNGIPDEAFKTLPGDEKEIASAYLKKNKQERKGLADKVGGVQLTTKDELENTVQESMVEYGTFTKLPESTPEEIAIKQNAYKKFLDGKGYMFLKLMADVQVAQFFIPKTTANKDKLITDNEYRQILAGQKSWQGKKTAMATAVAQEKKALHWFLEFPEVFQQDGLSAAAQAKAGFDCILGNPPFLGNRRLSGTFGESFLNWVKYEYSPIDSVDLVTYFFRRIFTIINNKGFQSLISTNTIAQGSAREGGLEHILQSGGTINHAIKSMKWPGIAAVEISIVTVTKRISVIDKTLNGQRVNEISSYLDNSDPKKKPFTLKSNEKTAYQGSLVLGNGFILTQKERDDIVSNNPKYNVIILPYLNGDDLNNNPFQKAERYVIYFRDWEESKCKEEYPLCYEILEQKVKQERLKKAPGNNWWQFWRIRNEMYGKLQNLDNVIVVARTSKTLAFVLTGKNQVLNANLTVISLDTFEKYSILQSTIHNSWAWQYCTTMKTDLIYQPSDVFETFAFPSVVSSELKLELIGETYHEHRRQLMLGIRLGLTKTYNLFHSNAINTENINKIDKQVAALQKYLENTNNTISFDETIKGILNLRKLHKQMDEAVLKAYGWADIQLRHDFYEVDYLPENDRVRYTIHPDARKEVLKRLLELNHQYYEEEIKQGLHKEEDVRKFYEQKGTAIPEEVMLLLQKSKKEKKPKPYKKAKGSKTVNEPQTGYGNLFNGNENE